MDLTCWAAIPLARRSRSKWPSSSPASAKKWRHCFCSILRGACRRYRLQPATYRRNPGGHSRAESGGSLFVAGRKSRCTSGSSHPGSGSARHFRECAGRLVFGIIVSCRLRSVAPTSSTYTEGRFSPTYRRDTPDLSPSSRIRRAATGRRWHGRTSSRGRSRFMKCLAAI